MLAPMSSIHTSTLGASAEVEWNTDSVRISALPGGWEDYSQSERSLFILQHL